MQNPKPTANQTLRRDTNAVVVQLADLTRARLARDGALILDTRDRLKDVGVVAWIAVGLATADLVMHLVSML